MNPDQAIIAIFGVLIAFSLYFAPAIVAKSRGHHNSLSIFLLNLFLGWTFFGWVGALVWSATRKSV